WRVFGLRTGQAKVADMIYGPKTDRILASVLTVASGGWLVLILLGYLVSLGWGHVLGLLVLFGIGVASLLTEKGGHDHAKKLTSGSGSIRGHLTAKASWSTSPALRITRLRSPPIARRVNAGPAPHHLAAGRATDRGQPAPACGSRGPGPKLER